MPQHWNDEQLSVMADFFFDSHEDFGGYGNSPQFSWLDPFDWSEILAKINCLGPLRNQGGLAGKWHNLSSVHLEKTGREPDSKFSKKDIATYEDGLQRYKDRLKNESLSN